MTRRNNLVSDVLDVQGPLMENMLTDIMISANRDDDMITSYNTGLGMKHLLLARLYMAKFLDNNNESAVKRVHVEFSNMQKYLDIIDKESQNPKRRKMLTTVKENKSKYLKAFDNLVNVILARNKIISGELDHIGPNIAKLVEDVKLSIKSVQDEMGPRLVASNQKSSNIIAILSIVALAVGIIFSFVITRSIVSPIAKGVRMANEMAKGDLTQQIEIDQEDEIGVLSKALNSMAENLKQMFGDIVYGTQTLTTSATELSAVSEQINTNCGQTADKSSAVAAAAEEMATNITGVAAATEQTTSNLQMIVSAAEEMTATINEIANNLSKGSTTTSHAVEQAKDVSKKVGELGKAAADISKVTETISDISKQTNLLALNATIEAARAGEAGKGFAVVAVEIKALAQKTAEATNEISDKISGVQATTSDSISAIESIVAIINDINEIVTTVATAVEEQSATTQEISNNVSQAAEGVQEVNENINQTTAVVAEVTQSIAEVNQAAEETRTGSRQVNTSARELSKLAETLNEMIRQFKI